MLATSVGVATAQTETSGRERPYHAEATKYNALDHTKLRVSFSLEKKRTLWGGMAHSLTLFLSNRLFGLGCPNNAYP